MKTPAKAHALRAAAPIYPSGARALVGAMWQRFRWRTWSAYAPADDRGVERSHFDDRIPF